MANNFEDEQLKQEEFNRLYRRLAKKIHPDNFPKEKYGSFLKSQAQELFKELEEIKSGKRKKNGRTAILGNWDEKLGEIREFEEEIDEFVSRAKRDAQPEHDSGSKNNSFKTEKKFKEDYADFFTRPRFDSEFSAMYVSGYNESTGKVKVKITPSGGRLEERELDSVEDLENIIKEVLTDKKKTFREVFGFDSSSRDNKSEEENKWEEFRKKYEEHEDFINKKGDYFDEEGNWIHFAGFGKEGVEIWDSLLGNKRRKMPLDEFEDLLKKYKHYKSGTEKKRKMEDVEKERAERAQEEINKQNFEEHPEQEDKKNEQQEESDQAAEEEMGEGKESENNPEDRNINTDQIHLEALVENARRDYSKKNYEVTNVLTRLKGVFGRNLTTEAPQMSDSQETLGRYKEALNNFLVFQIEDLQKKNLPPEELKKEMRDLSRYFDYDEKANLFDSRTQARMQVLQEKSPFFGKVAGGVANGAKKFFHWYTKNNSEDSRIKGAAKGIVRRGSFNLGVTGLGAGLAYMTVPGIGLGAFVAKRALGGVVSGVGVARMMEGRYRDKEKKRTAQEREAMLENIEKKTNPEEMYQEFMERMQKEMDGYQDNLRMELRNAAKRKVWGAAAGATAAIVAPKAFGYLTEKTGDLLNYVSGTNLTEKMSDIVSSAKERFTDVFKGQKTVGAGVDRVAKTGLRGYFEEKKDKIINSAGNKITETGKGGVKPEDLSGEKTGGGEHPGRVSEAAKTIAENPPKGATGALEAAHSGGSDTSIGKVEVPKGKVLSVDQWQKGKSGGTFEGTIKKYLMEERGMNRAEAGKAATLMRQEWETSHPDGKHYNLVHKGDQIKIEIGQDGKAHVAGFEKSESSGAGVAEQAKNGAGAQEIAEGKIPASDLPPNENIKNPRSFRAGGPDEARIAANRERISGDSATERPDMLKTFGWTNFDQDFSELRGMRDDIHRIYSEVPEARTADPFQIENELAMVDRDITTIHPMLEAQYGSDFKGAENLDGIDRTRAAADIDRFNSLTEKKMKLERILDAIDLKSKYLEKMQGLMGEMSKALYRDVPEISNWSDLKNIEAAEFLAQNQNGKLGEVQKYFKDILLGEYPKPKKGQSLFRWTALLCEAVADHKNIKI